MKKSEMGHEEKQAYEKKVQRELREVCATMLKLPPVVEAIDNRTALVLRCPQGHKLHMVDLDVEPDENLIHVRPIAERAHLRALPDTPFNDGNGTRVCRTPGCPTLVKGEGWCEKHGGLASPVHGT